MQFPVEFLFFPTWGLIYTELVFFFFFFLIGLIGVVSVFSCLVVSYPQLLCFFFSGPLYMEYDRRGRWNMEY